MSKNSRDAYFDLMRELEKTLIGKPELETTLVPDDIKKRIKDKGSSLRTSLSRDIGSRRQPAIRNE